jgi:hypothetical protein
MLESRWGRRVGPALAALGAVLMVATTATGAPRIEDRSPPDCDGPPMATDGLGAWFALESVIDRGTLVGHRLTVGTLDGPRWTIALPPEAWATGPSGGRVLFGSDDGRTSTTRMFDAGRGCVSVVADSTDIVRLAVLDLDGRIHEHRLARSDRSDLGIWTRRSGSESAERWLPPLPEDDRFGRTWRTDVAWSDDGRSLVVASCGELACRYRVADRSGLVRTLEDPGLGALVGMVEGRLVVRGACRGLPCALLAIDPATGERTVLDPDAGAVATTDGADGTVLVVADTTSDGVIALRAADPRTGRGTPFRADALPVAPHQGYGAELPRGWFLVLHDDDGRHAPELRASSLHHPSRPLHEVRP